MNDDREGVQPKRVVLEKRNGRLGREEQLLETVAGIFGIEVVYLTEKLVARGFAKLEKTDLVAGSVMFMRHALRAYGKNLDELETPCYPECLKGWLRRDISTCTLHQARLGLMAGRKLFIKPHRTKLFTGFVAEDSNDPRFNGAGKQQQVYVCEPVEFVSEWRAYVVNGRIVDIVQYAGNPGDCVNMVDVEFAVVDMRKARAPAGYVLDFGVMSNGKTALVEVNDGYAVGAYGSLPAIHYWNMIAERWQELIGVWWGE